MGYFKCFFAFTEMVIRIIIAAKIDSFSVLTKKNLTFLGKRPHFVKKSQYNDTK